MQNTAKILAKKNDKLEFDLKGSSFNRYVKVPTKFWKTSLHYKKTLKDTNYNQMSKDCQHQLLELDVEVANELTCLVHSDSEFLSSLGLMDYSLLFVIESCFEKPKLR